MEPVPWRTDRDLTSLAAAEVVERQFPGLAPTRVESFAEGWDSEAFLVNREWVFLFPKREEVIAPFLRGIRLTELVAEAVHVAVPEFRFFGEPDPLFPYPFAGYRMLPGVPGNEIRPERRHWPALAATLAATLDAVHALDPEPFKAGELPEDILTISETVSAAVREGLGDALDSRIAAFLRGEVDPPADSWSPPVPTHGDLLDYHLLLDPPGRRLTGVIDWMDAGVWDAVGDFVGLLLWLGEEFVEMVLDRYSRPVDAGFRQRLWHRARVVSLLEYGSALLPGSPLDPATGRGWMRNAFGL